MIFDLFLKAYAVTALMKMYVFEIAAGRKVDMLPEVGFQSLEDKFVICNCMLISVVDAVEYLHPLVILW